MKGPDTDLRLGRGAGLWQIVRLGKMGEVREVAGLQEWQSLDGQVIPSWERNSQGGQRLLLVVVWGTLGDANKCSSDCEYSSGPLPSEPWQLLLAC